jgi:glycosyltransferase involved in cell wall biosynthesis
MMCGTPVVTNRIGAAPEVVDEGVTGYCARDAKELASRVREALALERATVRRRAEERFSTARKVADHLALYEKVSDA